MRTSVRRFSPAVFAGLLALFIAGCATTPTPVVDFKQDYDFSHVEKIGFFNGSSHVSGDNPMQLSDMQIGRVDKALTNILQRKGFTVVENADEADLLLSWHLATQHKTDVQTYSSPSYGMGYGYGRYNAYAGYNCWDCFNTDVRVSNYTEGTFIVDMIDPATKKSVWRSVTQSRLKHRRDESQERYDEAATVVLTGFTPQAEGAAGN